MKVTFNIKNMDIDVVEKAIAQIERIKKDHPDINIYVEVEMV